MSCRSKIQPIDQVVERVRRSQNNGETVVMCHGCFDLVHPGHVRHLQHAARQGDRLLVSITGDELIDKGTGRPLIPQELRAENLAALDCVEWVTISRDKTAVDLLSRVRPDVYVKGREYEFNRDHRFRAEREAVESYGGRVVFTSGDVVFSSTALINALEGTANPVHTRLRRLSDRLDLSAAGIDQLIDGFRGKRVIVAGETITDTYVMCDRPDIAGESPIMTLRPIERRSFDGGAAVIARHLAALGARPCLLTALPRTPAAEAFRQRLAVEHVDIEWIEVPDSMMEKERYLVGASKVMKLDLGTPMTLDAAHQDRFIRLAETQARGADAMVIADFGQGLFTATMLDQLCRLVRPVVDLLVGDVSGRRSNLLAFRDMDLLTPSEAEVRAALHDYDVGLSTVVWGVLHRTGSRGALITLGSEGLISFEPRDGATEVSDDDWARRLDAEPIPALSPFAIDELGCGDALLAVATLTLAAGGSRSLAGLLGSIAASLESQKLGNIVVGAAELRRAARRLLAAELTWQSEPGLQLQIDAQRSASHA